MQVEVNSAPGRLAVMGIEIQERIKCRSRVRVQKRFAQPRHVDVADEQILSLIPRITEPKLPVPSFEVVAKFSHLTAQRDVQGRVRVNESFMSGTGVVNSAKPNACSDRETRPIGKEIWNRRISNCERIPRVHNWYTDAPGTKAKWFDLKPSSRE